MSWRPSRAQVLCLLGTVVAASCFALLTAYAGVHRSPTAADLDVQRAFIDHRGSIATAFARTLTFLGSTPELYAVLLLVVIVGWRRMPGIRLPVCCLLWLAAGQLVRTAVNQWIGRPRPPVELHLTGALGDAFPSGHTTSATIAYGLLAYLVSTYARRRRTVVLTTAIAVVTAVGVGLSRIYLGVHWPTDVAAGWSLGVLWLIIGYALLRWWASSPRSVPQGPAQVPQS